MKTQRLSRSLLGVSAGWLLAAGILLPSCSGDSTSAGDDFAGGSAGSTSGTAGSSGSSGTAGSAGSIGGSSGTAGSAGTIAGSAGSSGGGAGGTAGSAGTIQDGGPDVQTDGCVTNQPAPESPQDRKCSPATNNECDGNTDINPNFPNGGFGNGVDDDCDGQVDEGCPCNLPSGATKECYLVSGSQIDPATGKPSGYCLQNPGTITCVASGVEGQKSWDGFCKGAQPPYPDDACAPGDFDCDGVDANPANADCTCDEPPVVCPTDPVIISPFPYRNNLEDKKPNTLDIQDPAGNGSFIVDGFDWIRDDIQLSSANWKWTVTGGDCDNILPYPTFAIFNNKDTTASGTLQIGAAASNLGSNQKQRGWVVGPIAGNFAHQVWPAFALSGDYTVVGEFDIGSDHYSCNLRVQVRSPGLRAELCWDTVGNVSGQQSDVDLHLARLQGDQDGSHTHGWFQDSNPTSIQDDTYWDLVAPASVANPYNIDHPDWAHADSDATSCVGWASPASPTLPSCPNPRLDKDNISCNRDQVNPDITGVGTSSANRFCGPENINLDNPFPGEKFLVGANLYAGAPAKTHINIYCDGVRKLSLGYDPTTDPTVDFPYLKVAGQTAQGDFWTAARVTWNGGTDPCSIETVVADAPKADKEGTTGLCVETNPQNNSNTLPWWFTEGGGYPTNDPINALCWH